MVELPQILAGLTIKLIKAVTELTGGWIGKHRLRLLGLSLGRIGGLLLFLLSAFLTNYLNNGVFIRIEDGIMQSLGEKGILRMDNINGLF
jgi:hypothetical protein